MIVPKRFVSICARKSDIGVSSTDERLPYPALLITASSEPKAPIAAFTALAAADSSVTSSAKSLIWSPWRSDRSCRDSMSLAVANTLLPAARPASTIARPRPRQLPVTNHTCAIHPPLSSHPPGLLDICIIEFLPTDNPEARLGPPHSAIAPAAPAAIARWRMTLDHSADRLFG